MGLRHKSIRLRVLLLILVPLLSLLGVYAYATTTTVRAAVDLARAATVEDVTVAPTSSLMQDLAAERSQALLYLVAPSGRGLAALGGRQALTDRALKAFEGVSRSGPIAANASALDRADAASLIRAAARLRGLRAAVRSRAIGVQAVVDQYSALIRAGYDVIQQGIQQTDISAPVVTTAQQQTNLFLAAELALQESDLYVGTVAARSFTPAVRAEFAQLVGQRRFLVAEAVPQLDSTSAGLYRKYVTPGLSASLAAAEDAIIGRQPPRGLPPLPPAAWSGAVGPYATAMGKMLRAGTPAIVAQVRSDAQAKLLQLILSAALGLAAVVFSIIFSILVGRGLISQLKGLRLSALELANERLPSVIRRLRDGESVDVAAETPALEAGAAAAPRSSDEIDQVQEAFNVVQRTAIEAAVDEANLRRGISDVFRNLARRSQVLLHRQLRLLDGMERRASEPEELEDLFRIDHLTTRMRRHAEGLIILSGEPAGRTWRHPVPLMDVLRAAVAEVEDYTRIRVEARTRAALSGTAVADVIHLIAELAENATVFSPPNTPVKISGDVVGRGFAVEIEDRGLGITEERLAEINQHLADPPAFDLSGSDRLGLFIAGRLARRHDIKITLRPSVYGGTSAIVIIPTALVVDEDSYDNVPAIGAEARGLPLSGRHAALPDGAAPAGNTAAGNFAAGNGAAPAGPALGRGASPSGTASIPWPAEASPAPRPRRPASEPAPSLPAGAVQARPAAGGRPAPMLPGDSPSGGPPSGGPPSGGPPSGAPAAPASFGLPTRVRQASLAPQLRQPTRPDLAAGRSASLPSPEAARNTMAALQRGWELGRSAADGPSAPDAGVPPAADNSQEGRT